MPPRYYCACCGSADVKRMRKPKTQPRVSKPPSKPNARSKMWQSMRVLGTFTAPDLASTAETEVASVRNYVNALHEAGYVRTVRVSSGEVGDFTSWRLARNTGPQAPRLRADGKSVLDLNLPTGEQEVPRARGAR